ncbi:MAG: hypothetical protein ACRDGM_06530 [bacterium]
MSVEGVTGAMLLVAPVWFNVTFMMLARSFDYPDILRRPTDEVLTPRAHAWAGQKCVLPAMATGRFPVN